MNWFLLLPSTWNPLSALWTLLGNQTSQNTSQSLSDLFILVIIGIAMGIGVWALRLTFVSVRETGKYLNELKSDKNVINKISSSSLRLFRILNQHLIKIPSRDGAEQMLVRRTLEASDIFCESTLAPNLTSNRLFFAVPGILTGLGVLGTFVGLQMGIGGLNLNDLKMLDKTVVPLIQGCAIAFSTSVWGVLTSLLFSLFEKLLERFAIGKIRQLQNQIESLIPRYVPEDAMAELERTSRGTEEILKGLAVAIGDQMQQAIGRLGQEVKNALKDATFEGQGPLAEKSAEMLAHAITAELSKLKEQIGNMSNQFSQMFTGASSELMASVKGFEPTVKILSETVQNTQKTVVDAIEKLNSHESVMVQMTDAANQIHSAAGAFSSMKSVLENAASSNERAANAQLSAASSNEMVSNRFEDIGRQLPAIQDTLKDAAQVIASISGPISELKFYLEKLPDIQQADYEKRVQLSDQRDRQMLDITSDLAEKVTLAAEQFVKVGPLADKLAEAAKNLDDAGNELAIFGKQVLDASQKQKEASLASSKAAVYGEKSAILLSPIPEKIELLISSLDAAGSNLRTGAEAARNSYEKLIAQQELWFKGAEIGLRAMKDRLQEIIQSYGQQIEGQTQNLMTQWTDEVNSCLKTYQDQVVQLQGDLDILQTVLDRMNRR